MAYGAPELEPDWPCEELLASPPEPAYAWRNSATCWASSPTTMFAGMIAPEKPPLRIANRTSFFFSALTLKFGPLVRSPPLISRLDFEPDVAAASSVWQPEQRKLKSTAPWCRRGCDSGTLIDLPQAAKAVTATRQRAIVRLRRVTGAHLTREEPQASRRIPDRPRRRTDDLATRGLL